MEKAHRRGGKKNRKHGRQKRHPSALRYVRSGRLRTRKIRNLIRHCGLTPEAARALWESK